MVKKLFVASIVLFAFALMVRGTKSMFSGTAAVAGNSISTAANFNAPAQPPVQPQLPLPPPEEENPQPPVTPQIPPISFTVGE